MTIRTTTGSLRIASPSFSIPAGALPAPVRRALAGRHGAYVPPEHLRPRVHPLPLAPGFDEVSSSEVRRRIAAGESWERLVPEGVVELVRRIYRTS